MCFVYKEPPSKGLVGSEKDLTQTQDITLATRMATTIGQIQEFQPDNENFSSYIERVQLFFTANDIAEDKKIAVLLSMVGSKNYSLLRSLVAPRTPKDLSFDELVSTLRQHFEPKPVIIAEWFHFHRRSQAVGESIADYLAELRRLTVYCEFGAFLEQALRDRLVCGIHSEGIQKRLLAEADLTLATAVKIAQGMETAENNSRAFKDTVPSVQHFSVGTKLTTQTKKACYRCGQTSHDQTNCRFHGENCHQCGKQGHIASVCRLRQGQKSRKPKYYSSTKWVNAEDKEEDTIEDPEHLPLYTMKEHRSSSPIKISLQINNQPLQMEVDTGAAVSLISQRTYQEYLSQIPLEKSDILLKTYTREQVPVLGKMKVRVSYLQQSQELWLEVVTGKDQT